MSLNKVANLHSFKYLIDLKVNIQSPVIGKVSSPKFEASFILMMH